MLVAIIVCLVLLLAAAVAFIFWLFKVLKNTFTIAEGYAEMLQGRTPRRMKQAYDGKYYPANVIAQVKFNSPSEGKIVDWSMYEKYKIVGFTVLTTDRPQDYYGDEFIDSLDEETMKELLKPVLIKNALVYAPFEGEWTWKSAE